MSDYLTEEMQQRLWAGQRKEAKGLTEGFQQASRNIESLMAFQVVASMMLADIVRHQPDPAKYHGSLAQRVLSQFPGKLPDGTPLPLAGEIREVLAFIDPSRGSAKG